MSEKHPRNINFEGILNFRDLGGYKARGGKTIAWRRVYRSGEMHHMTGRDTVRLKEGIKLNSIIDLRSVHTIQNLGVESFNELGAKYYNIPLTIISKDDIENKQDPLWKYKNSREIYYHLLRLQQYGQKIIEALEVIARPENYPLVLHCNAGKDRSGILAAVLFSALGVADEDIIADYALTDQSMKAFIDRWNNDPETAEVHKNLPEYHLKAMPESMVLFLAALKKEYGSTEGYLKAQDADPSLVKRLEKALLV
jgi:protein-tyrosine phosphatase